MFGNYDKMREIIQDELNQMVNGILKKHTKNQENRENNHFICFENPYINYYMGMGRSFDSQLGNHLQKIAFRLARLNDNFIVHNILSLEIFENCLMVDFFDSKKSNTNTQKILLINKKKTFCDNLIDKIYLSEEQINFYDYLMDNKENLTIPVDLLYFNINKNAFLSFEIKAGRNLDTKNSESNYNEIKKLQKIFEPFPNSKSYFATCYNNKGEGKNPEGAIYDKLNHNETLIGKKFWKKILPDDISYKEFIDCYEEIFQYDVKVEERLKMEY